MGAAMVPRREFLNLVLFDRPGGWADKQAAHGSSAESSFARIVDFVQQAERAKLDAVFKADFLGFDKNNIINDPSLLGEPLAVTAALAALTERIGLVVTASTSFFEPYNLARQIATLHNVSAGRAGWNAVTSFNGEVNFGPSVLGAPAERYARAGEFIEVVVKLWTSWDTDALSFTDGAAPSVNPDRIHDIGHVGEHFSVQQALDVSRLVEDLPVVFQAGASEEGVRFAARFGEAVFVATPDLEHARTYYERLKALVVANGRHPDSLRVLPGIRTYIADTEEQALTEYREVFGEANYYESRLKFVKREAPSLNLDGLGLDDVITPDRIPSREHMAANHRRVSRGLLLRDLVTEVDGVTVRQFLQRIRGSGHLDVIGTADQVAEVFAEWFTVGASDGFTLHGGNSFDRFTGEVIPLLQDKGLVRRDYEGKTLRQNLGLQPYHLGLTANPAR
jgi:FMN-dependent oxidoreductase (nitrilotriacetate monooxygenase family)